MNDIVINLMFLALFFMLGFIFIGALFMDKSPKKYFTKTDDDELIRRIPFDEAKLDPNEKMLRLLWEKQPDKIAFDEEIFDVNLAGRFIRLLIQDLESGEKSYEDIKRDVADTIIAAVIILWQSKLADDPDFFGGKENYPFHI